MASAADCWSAPWSGLTSSCCCPVARKALAALSRSSSDFTLTLEIVERCQKLVQLGLQLDLFGRGPCGPDFREQVRLHYSAADRAQAVQGRVLLVHLQDGAEVPDQVACQPSRHAEAHAEKRYRAAHHALLQEFAGRFEVEEVDVDEVVEGAVEDVAERVRAARSCSWRFPRRR